MGKGDKNTEKGKISSGSYGVTRKRKKKAAFIAKPKAKKAAPKTAEVEETTKTPAKKTVTKKPAAKKTPAKKAPTKKKPTAKK